MTNCFSGVAEKIIAKESVWGVVVWTWGYMNKKFEVRIFETMKNFRIKIFKLNSIVLYDVQTVRMFFFFQIWSWSNISALENTNSIFNPLQNRNQASSIVCHQFQPSFQSCLNELSTIYSNCFVSAPKKALTAVSSWGNNVRRCSSRPKEASSSPCMIRPIINCKKNQQTQSERERSLASKKKTLGEWRRT